MSVGYVQSVDPFSHGYIYKVDYAADSLLCQ